MRLVWFIFNLVVWTILLGGAGLISILIDWKGRVLSRIPRLWSKILLRAAGVPYSVKGAENLVKGNHYFFAGNHESAFDILLAFAGIPFQLVSIAKKELKWIPFLGWAMQAAGHIFVDRQQHSKAVNSLDEAKKSLLKKPRSILLFPEGTRSLDGKIHTFKKGGLILAIQTDVSVVPIAFCGTSRVAVKHSWKFNPTSIQLQIGKPIPTEDITIADRDDFVARVRSEVISMKERWIKENPQP
jgi:1-acyl-sn-glycerol-3-phosphate acyltransferase